MSPESMFGNFNDIANTYRTYTTPELLQVRRAFLTDAKVVHTSEQKIFIAIRLTCIDGILLQRGELRPIEMPDWMWHQP